MSWLDEPQEIGEAPELDEVDTDELLDEEAEAEDDEEETEEDEDSDDEDDDGEIVDAHYEVERPDFDHHDVM